MRSQRLKKDVEDIRNTQELIIKTVSKQNNTITSMKNIIIKLSDDYRWRMDNDKQKEAEDFVKKR